MTIALEIGRSVRTVFVHEAVVVVVDRQAVVLVDQLGQCGLEIVVRVETVVVEVVRRVPLKEGIALVVPTAVGQRSHGRLGSSVGVVAVVRYAVVGVSLDEVTVPILAPVECNGQGLSQPTTAEARAVPQVPTRDHVDTIVVIIDRIPVLFGWVLAVEAVPVDVVDSVADSLVVRGRTILVDQLDQRVLQVSVRVVAVVLVHDTVTVLVLRRKSPIEEGAVVMHTAAGIDGRQRALQ